MTPLEPHVRRLLEWMPKAELHLHLDGSLRTNTAIELAQQHGIDAPHTWRDMFHALVAPEHPGSQAELLKAFETWIRDMPGNPAPEFAGNDVNGQRHTLSSLRGRYTFLAFVDWACPGARNLSQALNGYYKQYEGGNDGARGGRMN